jgi:hypothetical protein
MIRDRAASIALLALLMLGGASASASAPSGLRGLVTRSPITPVCIEGVPCSAPARNTPLVFVRTASRVATRTDGTGHYRVPLAPGWWSVTTPTRHIGSGISPNRVRVLGSRFRAVDLDIDTGIR